MSRRVRGWCPVIIGLFLTLTYANNKLGSTCPTHTHKRLRTADPCSQIFLPHKTSPPRLSPSRLPPLLSPYTCTIVLRIKRFVGEGVLYSTTVQFLKAFTCILKALSIYLNRTAMGSLALPDSQSSDLCLSHPTALECNTIWNNSSASWKDSLTVPLYLKESLFLTTVPLANDGGMTTWVLVDKNLPPDQRTILCSCESFRKRSFTSTSNGKVCEAIVHGIASVFCPPELRARGYAARMMRELAKVLHGWQAEHARCVGSILYSDIGKTYYSKLGWHPNLTNFHVVFQPSRKSDQSLAEAHAVATDSLAELCIRDEAMIRQAMAAPAEGINLRMTIVPDLDHMLWHIRKEEFACDLLFGKVPRAIGAIAGPPGSQVWVIWTHRYYEHPDAKSPDNTLYILRLVIENHSIERNFSSDADEKVLSAKHDEQTGYLKAVIQAAQAEAAEWRLDQVKLWDPIPAVQEMIAESGIDHSVVQREEDSIASGLWYDENGEASVAPLWINNEHFAWC